MKGHYFVFAVALSTAAAEIVYVEDIDLDHDKRHFQFGLPDALQFQLRRTSTEDIIPLNLRENKRLNANAPIYVSEKNTDGTTRIVQNRSIRPNYNVRFYQDYANSAFMKVQCWTSEAGPCKRILSGNLHIDGKAYTLEPAIDDLDSRELNSYPGTPHRLDAVTVHVRHEKITDFTYVKSNNDIRESINFTYRSTADHFDTGEGINSRRHIRNKRAPTAHGVEVLMVIDHKIYENFVKRYLGNENIMYKIREYFSHIVNGVDLRYASIQDDSMSIYVAVAGFYVSTDVNHSPSFNYNEDPTDYEAALDAITIWRKTAGLPAHDHAVLMTGPLAEVLGQGYKNISGWTVCYLEEVSATSKDSDQPVHTVNLTSLRLLLSVSPGDIRRLVKPLNHKNSRTDLGMDGNRVPLGIAWFAAACTDNRVSVVEENGPWETAVIMAHEIGHNIGAYHDGHENAQNCTADDKFIMGVGLVRVVTNTGPWRFSSCAVNDFKLYFGTIGQANDCTLNRAISYDEDEFNKHTVGLAGELYNLDDQCRLLRGAGAKFCGNNKNTESICRNLRCEPAMIPECESYIAAEGTPCGNGRICFEGTCQEADVCTYRPLDGIDIAKDFFRAAQSSEHVSDPRGAALALDGSLNTISHSGIQNDPWWTVEFQGNKSVVAVKIWNRKDCCSDQLSDFDIRVDGTLCGHLDGPVPLGGCFEVTCSPPIVGKSVEIKRKRQNDVLNLAEVQVFAACLPPGGVAHSTFSPVKPVYPSGDVITFTCDSCYTKTGGDVSRTCQTDGTWDGNPIVCTGNVKYLPYGGVPYKSVSQSSSVGGHQPATYAVDGTILVVSKTSTENNPWWKIEFCETMIIMSVKIWNQKYCCTDDLTNLNVTVDGNVCGYVSGSVALGGSTTVTCAGGHILGRSIKLQKIHTSASLVIAEVEVIVACPKPESPENTAYSPFQNYYMPGTDVTYHCEGCSEQTSGHATRRCTAGSWTGTPIICSDNALYIPGAKMPYRNVTQSSEHSNRRPATLALDGNYSTSSVTAIEDNPWWEVEFCNTVPVHEIRIWNREDCCAEDISNMLFTVGGVYCGDFEGPLGLGGMLGLLCQDPATGNVMRGKTVKIQRMKNQAGLNLAEVEIEVACPKPEDVEHSTITPYNLLYNVDQQINYTCDACYELQYGDLSRVCQPWGTWTNDPPTCSKTMFPAQIENENIARGNIVKAVTQSSESSDYRPATLAIDGILDTISHTNVENAPWWQIEFCTPVTIGRVKIWNRLDCCAGQLQGIWVLVDDLLFNFWNGPTDLGASVTIEPIFTPMNGTILRLWMPYGFSTVINIAEVQVFAK